MLSWHSRSFSHQVGIVIFTSAAILVGGYAYLDFRLESTTWLTAIREQASELMEITALTSASDLHDQKHSELLDKLKQLTAMQELSFSGRLYRLREVSILDSNGHIAAHSDPQNNPVGLPYSGKMPVNNRPIIPLGMNIHWKPISNEGFFAMTPINFGGKVIGQVVAEFDTTPLQEERSRRYRNFLFFIPLILLTTMFLTWRLTRWLTAPLKQATSLLDRLGQGDIIVPGLIARKDEYGELGRAIVYADKRIWKNNKDLQEQHLALTQAQTALNQFKDTLDQTLDCVFMFEPQGFKFTYVNRGALEQVGFSAEELLAMTSLDIQPDINKGEYARLIKPLVRGERQSVTYETRHCHKNGDLIPVEILLQYVYFPNEPSRFVAIVRDITERKRIEKELEAHHFQLEKLVRERTSRVQAQARIIDQAHDSIVTTDLDGVVRTWNGGAERLFGIPADNAIGKHIAFVYPVEQHGFLQNQVIKPLLEKGVHDTEVVMKHADGSPIYAHVSLSLLYNEEGVATGMVGYSLDISERIQRETELKTLTERLKASNKELEAFSYSVSHDLRAPLRAIDGFSLALIEDYQDKLDETGRDYLTRVRTGAQRMAALIDDLLQLSRITRSELEFKRVNLSLLAQNLINELRSGSQNRQVEAIIQPDMHITGDPLLLEVMLANLIGNAWKFTGQRDHASIELGSCLQNGKITFFVHDNGTGFDMKYATKLFNAFQRLHGLDQFEGTGIGLATVQRIVNRHGGIVWAESELGKGATFYFSLPERIRTERHKTQSKRVDHAEV